MKLQDYLRDIVIAFCEDGPSTRIEARSAYHRHLIAVTVGPLCDTPDKLASLLGIVAHDIYHHALRVVGDE